MAEINLEEMSQYTDSSSFDKIDASTFASTITGKKEEGKAKKAKILSYPLSRRQEQDTDYLEIVIAEYVPPGLALQGVSFTDTEKKNTGDGSNIVTTTAKSELIEKMLLLLLKREVSQTEKRKK